MARESTGGAYARRGKWFARVSVTAKKRKSILLPGIDDEATAKARASWMNDLVRQLRQARREEYIAEVVKQGALATGDAVSELTQIVAGICAGTEKPKAKPLPTRIETFKSVAELWTSGDLARRYPDHVRVKRTAETDKDRLEKVIIPLVGPTPIAAFRLEDAERVMAQLPARPDGKPLRPATRRHYIPHNPLPKGFLPAVSSAKAFSYVYPAEDAKLLEADADKVPLSFRVLYGFLAREGCRAGEAARLTWDALDLERGVLSLDENKTDEPRAWALDPGVRRALEAWKKRSPCTKATDNVFVHADGRGVNVDHLAGALRAHLEAAGVARPELFKNTETRQQLRAHDLRATFVTLSLANGKTEAWVTDRTGHTSSAMVARYRRTARTAAELGLGTLLPLDEAIPEFRQSAAQSAAASEAPIEAAHASAEKCTGRDSNSHASRRWNLNRANTQRYADDEQDPRESREGDAGDRSRSLPSPPVAAASTGAVDPVEAALADALTRAVEAGRFDVVAQVAKELEQRRLARAHNVIAIDSTRRRRIE